MSSHASFFYFLCCFVCIELMVEDNRLENTSFLLPFVCLFIIIILELLFINLFVMWVVVCVRYRSHVVMVVLSSLHLNSALASLHLCNLKTLYSSHFSLSLQFSAFNLSLPVKKKRKKKELFSN